jgi:hypothetical protein
MRAVIYSGAQLFPPIIIHQLDVLAAQNRKKATTPLR